MKEDTIIRNNKLASSISKMEEESNSLGSELDNLKNSIDSNTSNLNDLTKRLKELSKQRGISLPIFYDSSSNNEVDSHLDEEIHICDAKEFRLDSLSEIDIVVSCIAGGLGVLLDFLVVKIPKSINIVRDNQSIYQEGSPLTEWMRKIGFDKDGKTSTWVTTLEKYFKVNYDISIIKGEKGFGPRSHRIYSLAHDPSPSGLLWALKDMINGTFSYIDRDGILKIIPATKNSLFRIFSTPILWLGHLLSDIFTKAGVPLPGACLLRTLQIGSFGAKKRTLGEVIEYMYLKGYDIRHLATMSSVNACIEVIIRIYHMLTRPKVEHFGRPAAMIQADNVMITQKLQKMRFCGYAVAATGNIVKLASYNWNPLALNAPVWLNFVRNAISEYEYNHSTTKDIIDVMELRNEIEGDFERIQSKISKL